MSKVIFDREFNKTQEEMIVISIDLLWLLDERWKYFSTRLVLEAITTCKFDQLH